MRVFLTGATGFIGSTIIPLLMEAGHEVLGVTRSDDGARKLEAAGVESYRGTLTDPEGLQRGADTCEAVIHTAFDHDFSNFVANCEKDRRVIEAFGAAFAGSNRPLLVTSGVGVGDPGNGEPAREDVFNGKHPNPRIASEQAVNVLLERGVNASVVRLPQVHDPVKQGLITPLIEIARQQGVSAYVGEGANRWPAAHVSDVARLYVLALQHAQAGARWHAVAEEGVATHAIAEVIGKGLDVPVKSIGAEEAKTHFGWLGGFVGMDMRASSAHTRRVLGWHPTGPGLLEDLSAMRY